MSNKAEKSIHRFIMSSCDYRARDYHGKDRFKTSEGFERCDLWIPSPSNPCVILHGVWGCLRNSTVSVPDHCLFIYVSCNKDYLQCVCLSHEAVPAKSTTTRKIQALFIVVLSGKLKSN